MAAETLTVLVPDDRGVAAIGALDGVRAVSYEHDDLDVADREGAAVLVVGGPPSEVARRLAGELPALRLVQTLSAGFDVIGPLVPDGVAIANARGAHGAATAEWAAAALLAVVRELPAFAREQEAGTWDQRVTGTLLGASVLVVGAGDLATELRARLQPFGATVTLVGRSARAGVRARDELPALLPGHDAVVLMVPLDESTHGLADAAFLARMRDGAVLVNAARGPVVDTHALLAELESGRLRAALDVTDPEPLPAGHPLREARGVLITPHVGGATEGYVDRQWEVAAAQVAAFVRGEDPPNRVR